MKKITFILLMLVGVLEAEERTATFAGGCFWCMEAVFQPLAGVISAESGYMGGEAYTANYKAVSSGDSGHYEVVRVRYDSKKISYEKLLDVFWRNIDPLDKKGQFYDKGQQYETVIFYQNRQEKVLAKESKKALNATGRFSQQIATVIRPSTEFFKAEEYHQDYFKKNAFRYKMYKNASGRDKFLNETWK